MEVPATHRLETQAPLCPCPVMRNWENLLVSLSFSFPNYIRCTEFTHTSLSYWDHTNIEAI